MSKNRTIPPLYFLYRHIRHDTNTVFYVGRGQVYLYGNNHDGSIKSCYWRAFATNARNPFWKSIAKKTTYDVEIVLETTDFELVCKKENEFIKLYGRKDLGEGHLANLSDGGDGPINMSQHSIKKLKETAIKKGLYQKLREERQHDFYIYDLSGKFIRYAKNNDECANIVGSHKNTPNKYYREKRSINGFLITRDFCANGIDVSKYIISQRERVNILKYDKEFNLIRQYDTYSEAAELDDASPSSITRGLNTGKLIRGAYWKHGNMFSTIKIKKNDSCLA